MSEFLYVVWSKGPTPSFCMWISPFPSTICWKDYFFPIELSWYLCQKSMDHKCEGFFFGLSILFSWSICLTLCNTTLSWFCSFEVCFGIRTYETSNFVFSSRLLCSFAVPWNSVWISGWIFLFLKEKYYLEILTSTLNLFR